MADDVQAFVESAYSVRECYSSRPADVRFVTEGVSELAPGLSLVVTMGDSSWFGEFFGDTGEECSLVVEGVGPETLFVVSKGVGYLVEADEPATYSVASLRPIHEVLVAREAEVLLLVGQTTLSALGATGELWTSNRLVGDGFTEVRVASSVIVVRGYEAFTGRDLELTIDIRSGEVVS